MKNSLLMLVVLVVSLLFSTHSLALEYVSSPNYVVDCSGCTANQKKGEALYAPNTAVLYQPGTITTTSVDVTDFAGHVIVRYRVTLRRDNWGIWRSATSVTVPSATQQKFADADSLVNTLFLGPGEDFLGVDPVPVDYPSAFDLVGDNGYQANILSNAIDAEMGGLLMQAWLMVNDYLSQDRVTVVEALDGTIILVKAQLLSGDSIWWVVIEDGLRLADGNIIQEDWLDNQPISFSGGGIAIDQLYNGMTGLGYDVGIVYGGGSGQCEYEFACDGNNVCVLTASGNC